VRRLITAMAAAFLLLQAAPALADHATGVLSSPIGQPLSGQPVVDVGNWDFIANFPAGLGEEAPIGVDVERFTRKVDGKVHRFLIASSMTVGFSIFDVTNPGDPQRVSDYGSAACGPEAQVGQLIDILGFGRDFDEGSTALGMTHGWEDDIQITPNGKIAIIATDAAGRCHDPSWGGMEFVDVSDLENPSLLGLVRLTGESHNTTIDRNRPWIAYNSNSDTSGNDLIDIVDFKSCLQLNPAKCRPNVVRYQFKTGWTVGSKTLKPSACHDITYMLGKLWGACVNTTLVFDPSGVWKNGRLVGDDLTSAGDVGKKEACSKVDPSFEAMVEGVKVVDCTNWDEAAWKKANLKNGGLKLLSKVVHAGVNLSEDAPMRQDIQISHKADPLMGGKLMMVNDERGGGLNAPPGECPGGGLWFFDMRNLDHPTVARTPKGKKAVFAPSGDTLVQAEGSNCTSHVVWEWKPAGHLVSEAWYSSGTQVFEYRADFSTHPATVRFVKEKAFVPSGASTWTSRVYDQKNLKSGKRVLYFAATDITRGFDFMKLTLPAKHHHHE
jgi:hypothetical protein